MWLRLLLWLYCSWASHEDPAQRARALLAQMTPQEKVHMLHGSSSGGYTGKVTGNSRLQIPDLRLNDGPQGFRGDAGTSTAWPASLALGASWDPVLAEKWGEAMGREFFMKGANVQLGPGMCLARVPLCGRNFEYVGGEDPFLAATLVGPLVRGIQSQGVIATAKHYVNNNQEYNRTSIDARVDERTEFEMYLPPFEAAVKAGVGSFMCSYNLINGVYACENNATLLGHLKQTLGFEGWVMSDWGATHSLSINSGLDQEMPGGDYMNDTALLAAVAKGTVAQATVDNSVLRILTPMFAMGLFDTPNNNTVKNNVTSDQLRTLARQIAAESAILLKNTGSLLPLPTSGRLTIAVVGEAADLPTVVGSGSGSVDGGPILSPLNALRSSLGLSPAPPLADNCSSMHWLNDTDFDNEDQQHYSPADDILSCCRLCSATASCHAFNLDEGQCWMKNDARNPYRAPGQTSGTLVRGPAPVTPECDSTGTRCVLYAVSGPQALQIAQKADVVVVFAGTTSSEGYDRANLQLGQGEDDLITSVAQVQPKTVVVMVSPGAVLTPWNHLVASSLLFFMPGQEYALAVWDVLFGVVNPGGKLPLTLPTQPNLPPMTPQQYPGVSGQAFYSEQLEVGYRWYSVHSVVPQFPFGHGLSYTSFAYSNLTVTRTQITAQISNLGAVAGSEVVQLYLTFPPGAGEPPRQLKGFSKITLQPRASSTVVLPLTDRLLSIWDVSTHNWLLQTGTFLAQVGSSSQDIRLWANLTVGVS